MTAFDLDSFWTSESREHIETAEKTFATLKGDFSTLLSACETSITNGGKILFFGNGGSAADAQHLATELTVRYSKNRKPIAALALTTDTSALTAIGNDFGFEDLFARQIEALGNPGDVALGISTSGKSPNVLKALKTARAQNLKTVGFTGQNGGDMASLCDILIKIPSPITARIQEMHITLGQMLCGALEKKLGLV
ncbi:MAG: D-sedoheptulose 7-phosphate isomerase [Alphaproteobacteria bacterium]